MWCLVLVSLVLFLVVSPAVCHSWCLVVPQSLCHPAASAPKGCLMDSVTFVLCCWSRSFPLQGITFACCHSSAINALSLLKSCVMRSHTEYSEQIFWPRLIDRSRKFNSRATTATAQVAHILHVLTVAAVLVSCGHTLPARFEHYQSEHILRQPSHQMLVG